MAQTFDYIVAGGGSAGCVIASRLSEDPNVTVCLIEAGPVDRNLKIKVPLGLIWLMGSERFDWRFSSSPHKHLDGRQASIPRGKTLGGSGSINSMVYIRGRASDYDGWAAEGCTGWDWNNVLPYFKRQEKNIRLANSPLHGDSGALYVEDLPSPHALTDTLIEAGEQCDIPESTDFNGSIQEGMGVYQTTMHNGRRWSAADAFLRPALKRPNLHVITGAEANKLVFDGKRATGLQISRGGDTSTLHARQEIILSSGAIGSPAILMRSGVGAAGHLAGLGIDPVHDLPSVGANLHDHPAIAIHHAGGKAGYGFAPRNIPAMLAAPFRYALARKGLFASNSVEAGGFARTSPDLVEPDVQFHFIPALVNHTGSKFGLGHGYYSDVCLLKPKSRGQLKLTGKKGMGALDIDLNLLANSDDFETMVTGFELLRRILAAPAFDSVRSPEVFPGSSVATRDEIASFVKERLGTAYHPVGTCRMGAADDPRSVVKPDLKVIGLDNVRVVDASIMPDVIAGNTNAPTMMIAEKAGDIIAGVY